MCAALVLSTYNYERLDNSFRDIARSHRESILFKPGNNTSGVVVMGYYRGKYQIFACLKQIYLQTNLFT